MCFYWLSLPANSLYLRNDEAARAWPAQSENLLSFVGEYSDVTPSDRFFQPTSWKMANHQDKEHALARPAPSEDSLSHVGEHSDLEFPEEFDYSVVLPKEDDQDNAHASATPSHQGYFLSHVGKQDDEKFPEKMSHSAAINPEYNHAIAYALATPTQQQHSLSHGGQQSYSRLSEEFYHSAALNRKSHKADGLRGAKKKGTFNFRPPKWWGANYQMGMIEHMPHFLVKNQGKSEGTGFFQRVIDIEGKPKRGENQRPGPLKSQLNQGKLAK